MGRQSYQGRTEKIIKINRESSGNNSINVYFQILFSLQNIIKKRKKIQIRGSNSSSQNFRLAAKPRFIYAFVLRLF